MIKYIYHYTYIIMNFKIKSYNPRLEIVSAKPTPDEAKLFKIRAGNNVNALVLKIDILNRTIYIIYNKKAYRQWVEDMSYEYD